MSDKNSLPRAKPPRTLPKVVWAGILGSLLLIATAVIAIHDALAATHVVETSPLRSWLISINGLRSADWMMAVAALLTATGLGFLLLAVSRRKVTASRLASDRDIFIKHSAISKVAKTAAEGVPGVISASASYSHRRVMIDATTTRSDPHVKSNINKVVTNRVLPVIPAPAITVRTKVGGH